jgi:hypothetical protein
MWRKARSPALRLFRHGAVLAARTLRNVFVFSAVRRERAPLKDPRACPEHSEGAGLLVLHCNALVIPARIFVLIFWLATVQPRSRRIV